MFSLFAYDAKLIFKLHLLDYLSVLTRNKCVGSNLLTFCSHDAFMLVRRWFHNQE